MIKKIPIKNYIFVFLLFILAGLVIFGMVWFATSPTKISKDFCESLGFEKVTDEKLESWNKIVGVECDNEYIFNVCEKRRCIEKDKWGICSDEFYLEIQNSTKKCD